MNKYTPNTSFQVMTDNLEFDRHNPRLVAMEGLDNAPDLDIICALVEAADIGELVNSIVSNTYMDIEPMIVTEKNVKTAGNFRVLEGNRRLSAIRLIQHPDMARECRLTIPEDIPQTVYDSLNEVTVYLVKEEVDSRAFIGFKHINGAHRWDSYAKARFLAEWYISEYDTGITIEAIARQLGDQNQTVRNLIGGMLVLQQAQENQLFDISDRTKPGVFGFSHLYTALGRIQYRKFLGLDKEWNIRPEENPVSDKYHDKLQEILHYIYGSKQNDIKSVIKSQNPNLKELGEVIVHPMALEVLRSTHNLEQAKEEILDPSAVFNDSLITAHTKVRDTLRKTSKFSIEDKDLLLPLAREMTENSESILTLMEKKIDKS